jgi:DNA polymerase-4/protein ImuB
MGDIADLRQGPMEAQFGSVGRMIWKLSNGIDDRQLVPRKTIEVVSEHLTFQDYTISIPAILSAIESLLHKAFNHPQMQNCYARQASLQAQVFRRAPWNMCVPFKESTGSKDRMFFAIKAKLERVYIPGPLEDMRLTLSGLCGEVWRQESMWEEVKQKTHLREAMNQLQVRLGVTPPIYQVREVDPWSRIPERRHVLVHLDP